MEVHDTSAPAPTAGRYPAEEAELDARTKALESLLIEKGLIGSDTVDRIVEIYERDLGPLLGAKVVARAWVDAAFRERLLRNATEACKELGIGGMEGENMVAVENTGDVHHVVVCTLCSCYPWPVLGLPPSWYKSPPYRSRVVLEPRKVLADDFGLELDDSVEVRVLDASAAIRYFVLPERPPGTEGMGEDELAELVTRDALIGVAKVAAPAGRAA